MYDIAIIGAGINGCSVAYECTQEGKSVLLLDKEGIASGGSGAAGAFISPKFSKAGELKDILHEAFLYAMEYYATKFPNSFTKAQLLHIAKDLDDEEALRVYKSLTDLELKSVSDAVYETLTKEARGFEYVSLDAGVLNAQNVCREMCSDAEFVKEKVQTLLHNGEYWTINNSYKAKNVVLSIGAYRSVIKEPYIQIRGVWGHRIDIKTKITNPYSIHQYVSISPSVEGVVAIGATHNVHYHPQTSEEPYDFEQGRQELLEKARRTIQLDSVEIVKDYVGLRSGSFDYMPLIGALVDSQKTLECCEKNIRVKRPNFETFIYHPNLYMINGSGGYGFVLAPYLAKKLTNHILHAEPISPTLSPARFFARWAKRR